MATDDKRRLAWPMVRRSITELLAAAGLKSPLKHAALSALDRLGVQHGLSRPPVVFDQLAELARASVTPASGGQRVLMMSFRGAWLVHGAWEALIAEALRRRGAEPTIWVCSGGLSRALPGKNPACGIATIQVSGPPSCRECTRCGREMAGALGLPVIRTDDVVDAAQCRRISRFVDNLTNDELTALEYDGMPIARYVESTLNWYFCTARLDGGDEVLRARRAFTETAVRVAEAATAILDQLQPDVVVAVNGIFLAERILRQRAEERGIRVITYERGWMPNTLVFSEGIANYMEIDNLWPQIRGVPLGADQEAELDAYIEDRRAGRRSPVSLWPGGPTDDEEAIRTALDLDDREIVALFTNVTYDSAVIDRDRLFPDIRAWLAHTIDLFTRLPHAQLVIRIHPAEVRIATWQSRDPALTIIQQAFPDLPTNVTVIPPDSNISSYALMNLAKAGLVYSSTTGLEMAMEGRPVVVAGEVHYSGKGFTSDPSDATKYDDAVLAALSTERSPSTRTLARRYAHALFFRYAVPFPLIDEHPPDFIPTVGTQDPAVLDPGGDPTLDLVCEGILRGQPIYALATGRE